MRTKNFLNITVADFLVRSAYQMGKTPLLPIYAAMLGATDALLGFIVSVSTLTGMVLKPGIGILSDRWGRRWWLLMGTAFFAFVPFLYRFVHTPEQLFLIRIVHGTSTAIYGPVTLAYVAEQAQRRRAERLGWFGMARSAGYVIGPAVAGWLLLFMDPVHVFTIIGLISCVAFVPIAMLSESSAERLVTRPPLRRQFFAAMRAGTRTPAVWLAGGLEATTYVALYAVKTFLPIYLLAKDMNVALVGLFFSVQEAVHLILRPVGGRTGDRWGYTAAISVGMMALGVMLPLLGVVESAGGLLALASLLGAAQALVFPATVALVSAQIGREHVGAGMGIIGTLRNGGKVLGPIIGGFLIAWLDYGLMFGVLGVLLVAGALLLWFGAYRRQEHAAPAAEISGD